MKRLIALTARGLTMIAIICTFVSLALADRIHLSDGRTIEVDDVREEAQIVWYRKGNVTASIDRARVRSIEHTAQAKEETSAASGKIIAKIVKDSAAAGRPPTQPIWIYLADGGRVEVDEVRETSDGVWYQRGVLSIFLDRSRVARIEREPPQNASGSTIARVRKEGGWSTGNGSIDALIKQNGARFNVDPYLIFCVMEQESRFHTRALSPKGARGLMQLMPGTAARFGVRRAFDPSENIMGGTLYLKELLGQFKGRVDLVLASYNAGEGAVIKYGRQVPPYKETRQYVQRISKRYEQN